MTQDSRYQRQFTRGTHETLAPGRVMNLRTIVSRTYWLLSDQFGIDPRKMLRSLLGLPRYVRDYLRFRSGHKGRLELLPCLHDWHEEGGATKLEYFWQDLLVARKIFAARPERHVDVGSRVDGFVAHVASFREIEVFDVRPISAQVPGVKFSQADFMQPAAAMREYCDSLSCLHALEHFGLGRYGDPVDPKGFERGFANMAALLKPGGVFYLSVPIGLGRVEFNGQRVLEPQAIIRLARENSLEPRELTLIRQGGRVESVALDEVGLSELTRQRYALGMFVFAKHD
jgi:SAM-dependent methyltransferase